MDSALVTAIMKTLGSGGSVTHFRAGEGPVSGGSRGSFLPPGIKGPVGTKGFPPAQAKGLPAKKARPPVRPSNVREPQLRPHRELFGKPGSHPVPNTRSV